GAVLMAVARRLSTSGKAIGVDIWNAMDQSGNAQDVTLRNASLESVNDRVQVETGDMRSLLFADATFDLVLSSLALHNLRTNDERERAIVEAYRVLIPGGRLVIADIRSTKRYASVLRRLDATHVVRRRLGWRFWWGNPIAATTLVTASKARAAVLIAVAAGFIAATPAFGAQSATAPTFSQDIAPIVFANCSSCHRPRGAAPFRPPTLAGA